MATDITIAPPKHVGQTGRARLRSAGRVARTVFAMIGVGATLYVAAGFLADLSKFDQTRGGYEAPYTGWTGTPMDWSAVDVSPTGFARRGRVLDVLVDCTTGMIEMDLLGFGIPFRGFSERALIVHRPREACIDAGFTPQF